VYVSGSVARPEKVAARRTDIDLNLVFEPRSEHAELELRRMTRERQRRLNTVGNLFYNLDLIDLRDVDALRAFGSVWEMELDRIGARLCGQELWHAPARRPAPELRLEKLTFALRRWTNAGSRLLAMAAIEPARSQATRAVRAEEALGLVCDVIACWLDLDRFAEPAELLQAGRSAADRLGLPALAAMPARAFVTLDSESSSTSAWLSAALEALEAFVSEVSASWDEAWRVEAHGQPFEASAEFEQLAESLLRHRFQFVTVGRRCPHSDDVLPIAVSEPGLSARDVVDRALRALRAAAPALRSVLSSVRRPALLTPGLWRASVLLSPAPFRCISAAASSWSAGSSLAPPLAPGADLQRSMLRARLAESFTAIRAHGLRGDPASPRAAHALAADLYCYLPALERLMDTGVVASSCTHEIPLPSADERALVRVSREWFARVRAELAPLLAERLGG
jgi:hypothetical protein